jgi:hypothetical protein
MDGERLFEKLAGTGCGCSCGGAHAGKRRRYFAASVHSVVKSSQRLRATGSATPRLRQEAPRPGRAAGDSCGPGLSLKWVLGRETQDRESQRPIFVGIRRREQRVVSGPENITNHHDAQREVAP